jgi:hypothetical protein
MKMNPSLSLVIGSEKVSLYQAQKCAAVRLSESSRIRWAGNVERMLENDKCI